MPRPELYTKPQRDDAARREHQFAVKRAFVEFPAFSLSLLAAEVLPSTDTQAGYVNYTLPDSAQALTFTLKGALRLEMMNSKDERFQRFRRLFGSNTKAKDIKAWRSRVYIEAYANGAAAAQAIAAMLAPGTPAGELPARLGSVTNRVAVLQINDVYLDERRTTLLSALLHEFLTGKHSRLLRSCGVVQMLPPWNAPGAGGAQ